MAKTELVWYDANKVYPVFSGEYMVITRTGYIGTMFYSSVNHAFNTTDNMPESKAIENKIDVTAWSDIRETVDTLESEYHWKYIKLNK